jgi:hypothetical protein
LICVATRFVHCFWKLGHPAIGENFQNKRWTTAKDI